jgi:hypothetical protein
VAARDKGLEATPLPVVVEAPLRDPVREDMPRNWFKPASLLGKQGPQAPLDCCSPASPNVDVRAAHAAPPNPRALPPPPFFPFLHVQAGAVVWNNVKELAPAHGAFTHDVWASSKGLQVRTSTFAHQCRFRGIKDGKHCNQFLTISRKSNAPGGCHRTDPAKNHVTNKHENWIRDAKETQSAKMGAFYQTVPRPLHGPASKDAQLTAQAHFYTCGQTRASKRTFDDQFFRDVLVAQNPQCSFLARNKIKHHVAAEHLLFEVAFGWMLEKLSKDFEGNPFAQGMHDGVTLANKKCYQPMGFQGIFRGTSCTLSFGFRALRSHVATVVGDEFQAVMQRCTHLHHLMAFYSMMSDLAALKVASELLIDEIQKCKLHQGGKVGSSAMGLLAKSKNHVVPAHPVPWNVKIKPDFFFTRWQKSQTNFLKKAV